MNALPALNRSHAHFMPNNSLSSSRVNGENPSGFERSNSVVLSRRIQNEQPEPSVLPGGLDVIEVHPQARAGAVDQGQENRPAEGNAKGFSLLKKAWQGLKRLSKILLAFVGAGFLGTLVLLASPFLRHERAVISGPKMLRLAPNKAFQYARGVRPLLLDGEMFSRDATDGDGLTSLKDVACGLAGPFVGSFKFLLMKMEGEDPAALGREERQQAVLALARSHGVRIIDQRDPDVSANAIAHESTMVSLKGESPFVD